MPPKPPLISCSRSTASIMSSGVPTITPWRSITYSSRQSSATSGEAWPSVLSKYSRVTFRWPRRTSSIASSRLSARWIGIESRHSSRRISLPYSSAVCSAIDHSSASEVSRTIPRGVLSESTPAPCLPAVVTPAGVCTEATTSGIEGCW